MVKKLIWLATIDVQKERKTKKDGIDKKKTEKSKRPFFFTLWLDWLVGSIHWSKVTSVV